MKLDITIDESEIAENLTNRAQLEVELVAKRHINSLFQTKEMHGVDGTMTSEIKAKIELYTQSAEFKALIESTIQHFAGEAAREAISALMRSKSRKMLFEPTAPDILKGLQNE